MIKRFDIVVIKTVEHVEWVSGPANRPASPKGLWVVAAGVGENELLLTRDETVIRIPTADVQKTVDYDPQTAIEQLKHIKSMDDLRRTSDVKEG